MSRTKRKAARDAFEKAWSWTDRSEAKEMAPNQGPWGRCISIHVSSLYVVLVYERATALGQVVHLAVRRADSKPGIGWSHLQRIKNDLVGPERLAIEIYPPESEIVDEAHMYHLWVLPIGHALPFGLKGPVGLMAATAVAMGGRDG